MGFSIIRVVLCATLATFVAAFARPAAAYPYQLYAKYKSTTGNADIVVQLGTDDPTVVPSDPLNAKLTGIFIKTKTDELARSELARLMTIVVEVRAGEYATSQATVISREEFMSNTPAEKLIFAPRALAFRHPVLPITINVHAKLTSTYLCEQERQVRASNPTPLTIAGFKDGANVRAAPARDPKTGTLLLDRAEPAKASLTALDPVTASLLRPIKDPGAPVPAAPAAQKPKQTEEQKPPPVSAYAYTTLFSQGVRDTHNAPIIYSFCPNVGDQIDWLAVAANLAPGRVDPNGDLVHTEQKAKLVAKVLDHIKKETGESVELARHDKEPFDAVYTRLTHAVALLQDLSDLELYETSRSGHERMVNVVDKSSQLVLGVLPGSMFCSDVSACNTVVKNLLSGTVSYTDKQGKPVSKQASLESRGNEWMILPNLAENIGDDLTITISYYVDDDTKLELIRRTTTVENLGLITTFPLVTEVAAAMTKNASNPADISSQSSIPLSVAIRIRREEAVRAAVTFPWMIGINTRDFPKLADVLKVFPAVSIIFPNQSDGSEHGTEVAVGGGIALANAFTFSVATTVKDSPRSYFLVGISLPDLVKSFAK